MSRTVRRSAAALVYDAKGNDRAPRVIAKGYGLVAEMIIQRAREAGLYVHEAPEMVSLLMQVDLDARIPPQLYQAVAELLAWLHRLESGAADESPATAVAVVSEASVARTEAPVGARHSNSTDDSAEDSTDDSDAF
jgi:flagellar biosynthesis protein